MHLRIYEFTHDMTKRLERIEYSAILTVSGARRGCIMRGCFIFQVLKNLHQVVFSQPTELKYWTLNCAILSHIRGYK